MEKKITLQLHTSGNSFAKEVKQVKLGEIKY